MQFFCLFKTFQIYSERVAAVVGAYEAPSSLPIPLSWKVTTHGAQPDSLILLALPNSLCPKALKLQIPMCSLPRLPHCEIQHLPLL